MSNSTHVPAQLFGYMLQTRHMMYELISLKPEHIVSVEAFDDVAIQTTDGIIAQQLKSVLSRNNPLANRAEVFWKTIYNWLNYIKDGSMAVNKTIYRMIVIANKSIEAGDIIIQMFNAKTDAEAEAALLSAKNILWGIDETKKTEAPESYASYLEEIFNKSNKDIIVSIIKGMELELYTNDYDEKLYNKFCAQPIDDRFHDKLFLLMLGWVNERVNSFLKQNKAAFIKCGEFKDELVKQQKSFKENAMLAAASVSPTDVEKASELDKQDIYIKQLGLIELDIESKLAAASDFLRTKTTKIEWAERGIVNQPNIDEYNQLLIRNWKLHRKLSELRTEDAAVDVGKSLYINCQLDAQKMRIQNSDPPDFFGSGSLHALANAPSIEPQIGWHPQYKNLLKTKEGRDE